ncbi:hypothetical protein HDV63DRAFT_308398 [Trichoderma sp. SZMC 28014]
MVGIPPPLPNSSNSPPEGAIPTNCAVQQIRPTQIHTRSHLHSPFLRSQTRPKVPSLLHILRRDRIFFLLFIPSVAGQCVLRCQVRPCQLSGPENLFPLVADTRAYQNIGTCMLTGTLARVEFHHVKTSSPLIPLTPLDTSHPKKQEAKKGPHSISENRSIVSAAGYLSKNKKEPLVASVNLDSASLPSSLSPRFASWLRGALADRQSTRPGRSSKRLGDLPSPLSLTRWEKGPPASPRRHRALYWCHRPTL